MTTWLLIATCVWVIFLGGAEKLEDTFLGYFEFGESGSRAGYIKAISWIALLASIYLLATES